MALQIRCEFCLQGVLLSTRCLRSAACRGTQKGGSFLDKKLAECLLPYKNFAFVGEAGSGKSEIAINIAIRMKRESNLEVHFFDMDQTKPLARSRDVRKELESYGILFHYEEQFFDAPTQVGGVLEKLQDPGSLVVMDVGGNHTGARLIGGYSGWLNHPDTKCYFVVNPYRPWSQRIESIDGTLSSILKSSHIHDFGIISNPNLGADTSVDEVIRGHRMLTDMISEYKAIDFLCVEDQIAEEIAQKGKLPVMPIHLYLKNLYC